MISEEEDSLAVLDGSRARLDPLAHARTAIEGLNESNRSLRRVCPVVLAHDGLDGLGGFVGMVEGDRAHVVVENMGLDDTVEEMSANKTEFAIDCRGGATHEIPLLGGVVGERRVSVLEESNGDYEKQTRQR